MVHNAYLNKEYHLADTENTFAIGKALAEHWMATLPENAPRIWYLVGDLGAGKTTLSQAFIKTLMQAPNLRVKSPTYTLIEHYESADYQLVHADLYRLAEAEELDYLGFRDLEAQADIMLIEWPSNACGCLPAADMSVTLCSLDIGRKLTLSAGDSAMERWLQAFRFNSN